MQAESTHCIFRRGTRWLALPTTHLREVLQRPPMVDIPHTPRAFAGLCYYRSEFIPVIRLDVILSEDGGAGDQFLIVLDDKDGPWAVLVDEVRELTALDISDAPQTSDVRWSSAIVGWSKHRERIVEVLDPHCVRRLCEEELATLQVTATPTFRHPAEAADCSRA